MNKTKSPLAVDKHGKKYIEAKAIMSGLVPFIDGLAVTYFGRSKRMYLDLDVAINWVREEMKYHSRDKYAKILDMLLRFSETDTAPEPKSIDMAKP